MIKMTKTVREVELETELRGLIQNLKELLEIYDQSKGSHTTVWRYMELIKGVREIVEDYE